MNQPFLRLLTVIVVMHPIDPAAPGLPCHPGVSPADAVISRRVPGFRRGLPYRAAPNRIINQKMLRQLPVCLPSDGSTPSTGSA